MEVQSDSIRSIDYDAETRVMTVTFKTGGVYEYAGVPANVVSAMTSAPSVGRAFRETVRDRFPCKKKG